MYTLPPLPYAIDALEPHISGETLDFHYNKHHKGYVDKLNELTEGKWNQRMSLEELIMHSSGSLFNNAAQVWNHNFFWKCLTPNGKGVPDGQIAELINQKWGTFEKFQEKFKEAALQQFGSGWTWLVMKKDGLDIVTTTNAHNPVELHQHVLMTLDVWEHAYYLDYKNERAEFVEAFWKLANWDFANEQLTI